MPYSILTVILTMRSNNTSSQTSATAGTLRSAQNQVKRASHSQDSQGEGVDSQPELTPAATNQGELPTVDLGPEPTSALDAELARDEVY